MTYYIINVYGNSIYIINNIMELYLYLILILSFICTTFVIFSNKIFKFIISFLLLIINFFSIGLLNNNILLSVFDTRVNFFNKKINLTCFLGIE